jgi:hypothetical protein
MFEINCKETLHDKHALPPSPPPAPREHIVASLKAVLFYKAL